jgi:hypothetical protein
MVGNTTTQWCVFHEKSNNYHEVKFVHSQKISWHVSLVVYGNTPMWSFMLDLHCASNELMPHAASGMSTGGILFFYIKTTIEIFKKV